MAIALAAGLGGGLAGGLLALQGGGDQPAPGTPVVEAGATAADERVRLAVERVRPAIVTLLVDFPATRDAAGRVVEHGSVGTGIVVSDAGHVITNYHVVAGAESITAVLATGERRPAVLLADDAPFTDLAVLLLPPQGLRKATLGDSSALRPGDPVVAVAGSLLFFEHSASLGVVSGVGRQWPRNGVILEDLLQTDAAVNSGDSGGALVNLQGEVVGLITAVALEAPDGSPLRGVAFAQSSDTLRPIVEEIVATGRYGRPRIGIERTPEQHIEVSPELASALGLPVQAGALVIAPAPGSAAAGAGVRAGDIVLAMNAVDIDFDNPLPNILKRLPPGADAELLILRDGRRIMITVSPREE